MSRPPLITVSKRGLYCPPGDFYIDPAKPVQTAIVTHAHGDHLREGSARMFLASAGVGIARKRLNDARNVVPLDYGAAVTLGPVQVSLHPAGHILGSAQVRLEHDGEVWVVSGDYKRQADPTCAPFEPLPCDVFVSETTFGQPHFVWPHTSDVVRNIVRWWHINRERGRNSVLFCYALGKAQRVLAEMRAHTDEAVYVHGEIGTLVEVYRSAGVAMVPTLPVTATSAAELRGALVMASPTMNRSSWLKRLGLGARGFCSGWMMLPGESGRRGYDMGFVISDHADWPALVRTCQESRAKRILLMHGRTERLAAHLNALGFQAAALAEITADQLPLFDARMG
ncbi:MAG TPA: ligase-associated DNA damage response exonuclease [Steroidobacteraceae bacterium]|nr:ligase-associated DNA damage response exonuclease [Steroidobacteraceae bacterium]